MIRNIHTNVFDVFLTVGREKACYKASGRPEGMDSLPERKQPRHREGHR